MYDITAVIIILVLVGGSYIKTSSALYRKGEHNDMPWRIAEIFIVGFLVTAAVSLAHMLTDRT
jgi:hypothetical protein